MFLREKDVRWKAVRASGPGGQRVNRRSTKVQMWIKISDLPMSERERKLVRRKLARHLNRNDEIEVWYEAERSQEENKDHALAHLNQIVLDALKVRSPRIPTEPPRGREDKRIKEKKLVSEKKRSRRASH